MFHFKKDGQTSPLGQADIEEAQREKQRLEVWKPRDMSDVVTRWSPDDHQLQGGSWNMLIPSSESHALLVTLGVPFDLQHEKMLNKLSG